MRLSLLTAAALCLFAVPTTFAAHDGSTSSRVWIQGSWVSNNGCSTWRPGYWQTSQTTVCSTPSPQYVEGHWAQSPNGWVWVEGHYVQPPTVCTTVPTRPPTHTTVVVGGGHGYHSGYHHGSYGHHGHHGHHSGVYVGVGINSGHNHYNSGHHNSGHHGHHSSQTTVVATPRPVIVRPPSINLPKLPAPPRVNVKLPSLPKLPKLPNPFK